MKTTAQTHSEEQAQAQLDSIKEMVSNLGDGKYGKAVEAILDDPLSVQVRSDWYEPSDAIKSKTLPAEFNILLCTGGPAVRIIGELSEHAEPESARLEHQDWGTPWTEYKISGDDERTLLTYCRQFYFGE